MYACSGYVKENAKLIRCCISVNLHSSNLRMFTIGCLKKIEASFDVHAKFMEPSAVDFCIGLLFWNVKTISKKSIRSSGKNLLHFHSYFGEYCFLIEFCTNCDYGKCIRWLSHRHHACNYWYLNSIHTDFVNMFMVYIHTRFYVI